MRVDIIIIEKTTLRTCRLQDRTAETIVTKPY